MRGRAIGESRLSGQYAQVGHSRSLGCLRRELAGLVVHYRLDDLDAAAVRLRAPREFTQRVSRFVYEGTAGDGQPQLHGVAYPSRPGDDLVNYATFELPDGANIEPVAAVPVQADEDALDRAMTHLGLVWHVDERLAQHRSVGLGAQ